MTDRRLRQPDMDERLQPVRVGHSRLYRADAVQAELDRRVERALTKKGQTR